MKPGQSILIVALITLVFCAAPSLSETVRGNAQVNGVSTAIELRTEVGWGELRHHSAGGTGKWQTIPLDDPDQVLDLLADQRLSFLWPAIDRWAGADLVRLRDASVERARHAWDKLRAKPLPADDYKAMQRNVEALLAYTDALSAAGRSAEAADLLAARRDGLAQGGMIEISAWIVVSDRLASVRLNMGDLDGSLALLRNVVSTAGVPQDINTRATLAAFLAEHQQSEEALTIIEDSRRVFDAVPSDPDAVSGAHLQFDWIRACALRGLGRTADADALMSSVKAAPQPGRSKTNDIVPPKNFDIAVRADSCARNVAALAETLSQELAAPPLGSNVFRYMQPGYTQKYLDRSLFVRARERVRSGSIWRMLPARYQGAIAHWSAD